MIIVSALQSSSAKRTENGRNDQVVSVSIVCHLTVDNDFIVSDLHKHWSAIGCCNYYSLLACAHVTLVSDNQSVTHALCLIAHSVVV